MKNFSVDELAQKDFLICVGVWVILEIVSFLIFPAFRLIQVPGSRLQTWFLISLPLGLGGAFLVALSSRYMAVVNERESGQSKNVRLWAGQIMGGLGLTGIVFPLLVAMLEFFARMFSGL